MFNILHNSKITLDRNYFTFFVFGWRILDIQTCWGWTGETKASFHASGVEI